VAFLIGTACVHARVGDGVTRRVLRDKCALFEGTGVSHRSGMSADDKEKRWQAFTMVHNGSANWTSRWRRLALSPELIIVPGSLLDIFTAGR